MHVEHRKKKIKERDKDSEGLDCFLDIVNRQNMMSSPRVLLPTILRKRN
jgi:hypothetical protein